MHLSNSDSNKVTIFLGINGTSKSRILRSLLDNGVSAINNEGQQVPMFPDPSASQACKPLYYLEPEKIIAISSVPTDRFPTKSRFSNFRNKKTIHDINQYEYIGPKHNNNIVSRMQSLEALITLSLSNIAPNKNQIAFIKMLSEKTDVPYNFNVRVLNAELMNAIISSDRSNEHSDRRLGDVVNAMPEFSGKLKDKEWLAKSFEILKDILEKRELSFGLTNDSLNNAEYNNVLLDHLRIKSIKLSSKLSANNSDKKDEKFSQGIEHFSSGQWGLFSSLSALSLSVVDNSMILIDEPESTLHPSWQRSYIDDLLQAIKHVKGCHVFIATHSPLLVNALPDGKGEIILLRKNNSEVIAEKVDSPPHGWNANDILEKFFDLDSTRPESVVRTIEKCLGLISSGFSINRMELMEILPDLSVLLHSLPDEDNLKSIISSLIKAIEKGVGNGI